LACLREAAGITLEQISDSTKISRTFLAAIEDGRFNDLPGGVFTRSYIRQYAAAIGCDPDPILRSLESPVPAPEMPARKSSQSEPTNPLVRFFSLG
jgi:cytoskeletal protein RodZ